LKLETLLKGGFTNSLKKQAFSKEMIQKAAALI
jgi:hypothetical protein